MILHIGRFLDVTKYPWVPDPWPENCWSFRETTVRGTPSVEKRPFCMVLEARTDAGFHIIWRFQLRQILTHRIHVCYLW